MSMLGAGELCRAILEDKDVARAFDLDDDGETSLFSSYRQAADYAGSARSQLRVVGFFGFPQTGSQMLATLGVGGSISIP